MSNPPPTSSFGGLSSYAHQWPSSNPAPSGPMPSLLPPNLPFNQSQSPAFQQPQQGSAQYPFDYNEVNFNAQSHLPGLGAPIPTGSLPPPPFPFMGPFPHPQFPPPPFPQMHIPPLRYPPLPVPSASINTPPSHPLPSETNPQSNTGLATNANPQPVNSTTSPQDMDREEGELTDREGTSSQQGFGPRHATSPARSSYVPPRTSKPQNRPIMNGRGHQNPNSKKGRPNGYPLNDSDSDSSSSEEGEASSSDSESSSRASGSPYNPPISVTAEPFFSPDGVRPALNGISSPGLSANPAPAALSTGTQALPSLGKSAAQLRVQAQGALLSLAPHNIRYSELVGEGIDPVILRQLYEEVGIKVPTPQPDAKLPASPTNRDRPSSSLMLTAEPSHEQQREKEQTVESPELADAVPAPITSAAQLDTAKPMERKEVIARMLAAKAAKSSGAPTSPPGGTDKAPTSSDSDMDKPILSAEPPAQYKEVRAKEKNKAQTELARQRIEQLKKQGLMRLQAKVDTVDPPSNQVQLNTKSTHDAVSGLNSVTIQHPLPERPPDPDNSALARIPGLFMTDTGNKSSSEPFITPTQGLAVDSTPQIRANQRKRPRASDFDEPVSVPKNTFHNGLDQIHMPPDRLIIDISEDELYGDDDDDDMEIDDEAEYGVRDVVSNFAAEDSSRAYASADSLSRPVTSSPGFSLSATPQNSRNHDPEDLRKKHLEIQAMHRRIAELEQRKKAKLDASRTQSPHVMDSSSSSPPERSTPVDDCPVAVDASTTHVSSQTDIPDSVATLTPLVQSDGNTQNGITCNLDGMDTEQLEQVKSKFLRKQEIESGVPALDVEIQKSEARLGDVKVEEAKLSLEISRGKEGRQHLLEELNGLHAELYGLSLDQVELALHKLKAQEQEAANQEAPEHIAPENDRSEMPNGSETETQVNEEPLPAKEPSTEAPAERDVSSQLSGHTVGQHDVPEASRESTPTSSDSSGSSMDESSDSDSDSESDSDDDSDGPVSDDEDESMVQSLAPEAVDTESIGEVKESNQVEPSQPKEGLHPLPERPQSMDIDPQNDPVSSAGEQVVEMTEDQASDQSTVSEVYEPPEPDTNGSLADSAYTPPFSPASPGPVDSTASKSLEEETQNTGELPIRNAHEIGISQSNADTQVGLLDNARQPADSGHKFSPYSSPLKSFKAYRYHPNYTDEVTGGYRSLTYSHNIDPMVYLCPFEGAGGVCNDRSCEFQHFRDMTLSDDKILVQMGSLREGKTPEEKDNYIAGLKNIINDMRRDKVKDFSTVATEIAAYRRRFLEDSSRILPL
ncbi:hypothetical protein BDV25DRAFT_151752 [Aspergillus avenaceus]|uniref:Putative zinc-finger domain-containing protein n=1 Tax=Aspergillus avenaceus TaxID=36643 RepID=A0A5N6U059_ASPAV|nr:hypothetical protein BDV25DRAFT_151752 [Aspergillus avenaceus]